MLAFRVAYDGRPFHGFQRQPDVDTVEDRIFDALRDLEVLTDGAPEGYAAAGRTDAGVSALAQTVAFECPDWCSPAALNGELPADVRAWASADVPADFHATHDAHSRAYTYHLYAPDLEDDRAWSAFEDERARTALDALRGGHDFHNLTPDEAGTVRDLDAELARDGDFLVLRFEAGGFARQLVRRLVSLVESVAAGRADLAFVERVLDDEPLDGPEGVGPAPPEPLVLTDVDYPGVSFEVDADAAESARAVFADRHREAATTARTLETVHDGI